MARLPYSPGFDPVVSPGDFVRIVLIDRVVDAVVVTEPEPIHIEPVVVSAPGDREVELDTKDYLALGDYEIGLVRVFIPQPVVYRVNQPPSTRRFGTKYADGVVYSGSATHLQEIYLYKDITPKLRIMSAVGVPVTAAIGFQGYKWEIRPVTGRPSGKPVLWPVAYGAPQQPVKHVETSYWG